MMKLLQGEGEKKKNVSWSNSVAKQLFVKGTKRAGEIIELACIIHGKLQRSRAAGLRRHEAACEWSDSTRQDQRHTNADAAGTLGRLQQHNDLYLHRTKRHKQQMDGWMDGVRKGGREGGRDGLIGWMCHLRVGWIDGHGLHRRMNECVSTLKWWTDGEVCCRTDKLREGGRNGWMEGWMDKNINEWIDWWMNNGWMDGYVT